MSVIIPAYLKEYFKGLEETYSIKLTKGQMDWYTMKYKEQGELVKQEFPSTPEEAFLGSHDGFWYLRDMNQCRTNGQFTNVPYQPDLTVNTAWDIGYGDHTCIWFYQLLPSGNLHIIDYYEDNHAGVAFYAGIIHKKPYSYNKHFLPHDAKAHDKGLGVSYAEQAKMAGLNIEILQSYTQKKSQFILEVQKVRNLLTRCWFDEDKCGRGIECLENYKKRWNESMGEYTSDPVHDWASHGSDAFRYLANSVESKTSKIDEELLSQERSKLKALRRRRF